MRAYVPDPPPPVKHDELGLLAPISLVQQGQFPVPIQEHTHKEYTRECNYFQA